MNSKMLIQGQSKLKKFSETLDRRIDLLTKNQDNSTIVAKIDLVVDELMTGG